MVCVFCLLFNLAKYLIKNYANKVGKLTLIKKTFIVDKHDIMIEISDTSKDETT